MRVRRFCARVLLFVTCFGCPALLHAENRAQLIAASGYPTHISSLRNQRIVEIYGDLGADMPAPYFEGTLDKPAFSGKAAQLIWQADGRAGKLAVAAGELNGIGEGAILSLFDAGAAGASSPAIGYARVELATASRSEATSIAYAHKKPLTMAGGEHLRARLERPGIRAVLRVALPPADDGAGTAPERSGRAAIEVLQTTAPDKRGFCWNGWQRANLPTCTCVC
jgi:hypothetical protein